MLKKVSTILQVHSRVAIGTFAFSLLLLVAFGLLSPKVYESHTTIHLQKKVPTIDEKSNSQSIFSDNDLVDHIKIMKSNVVVENVARRVKEKFPKHPVSKGLIASKLKTSGTKNTRILDISFQHGKPEMTREVLAITLEEYENALRDIARQTKLKGLEVLRNRLSKLREERSIAEDELEKYSIESGTLDASIKNNELVKVSLSYSQTLEDLNSRIISNEREIGQINQLLGLNPEEIKNLSRIKDDVKIQAWQSELGTAQAELSDMRASYTDKFSGIAQKKREIQLLEDMISRRITEHYGKPVNRSNESFSQVDSSLGQKLLNLTIEQIGLMGQQRFYEELMASLPEDFTQLAQQSRRLGQLKYRIASLLEEEKKLTAKLQEGDVEKDFIDSMGSFIVITPPTSPQNGDYIYPLKPKLAITYGFFASLFLSVFSIGLLEYLNPKVIDMNALPILAEMTETIKFENDPQLAVAFQNAALLIKKSNMKTLTLLHLCESNPAKTNKCPYSPGLFATALVGMFAKRGVKTLLVESTGSCCTDKDLAGYEQIANVAEYSLYKADESDKLHILAPNSANGTFFDPYILKLIPNAESYDLIFLNLSLTQNEMIDQLLCEVSDATFVGISKSKTESNVLRNFQRISSERQVTLVGSILFS